MRNASMRPLSHSFGNLILTLVILNGSGTLAQTLESPNATAKQINLTLDQAVATAIQNAISVQKAKNDVESSGVQLMQAYGQFLPNLGILAGTNEAFGTSFVTATSPFVVQGQSYGANLQVSSSINLYNGKGDIASLKAALARKSASSLSLERAKQQIALDVTQSFLQIVLDHQIVQFAEKNLSYSRERQSQLETLTRVGTKNKVDLFRQQAQTSADEYYYINSKNHERNSELLLLRKLRMEFDSNYTFVEPSHEDINKRLSYPNDEGQLVKMALANRPDLSASEVLVNAASWDIKSARAQYLPHLDFAVGALSSGREFQYLNVNGVNAEPANQSPLSNQLGNQISYSLGLTLTWNIFDRDLTKANIARATVNESNARLDFSDRRNQVINEIRQAYGDIQTAKKQIESTQSGLFSAAKAFDLIRTRFELGSANFIDLITSQGALVQAQSLHAQSRINYDLQVQVLKTVIGGFDRNAF